MVKVSEDAKLQVERLTNVKFGNKALEKTYKASSVEQREAINNLLNGIIDGGSSLVTNTSVYDEVRKQIIKYNGNKMTNGEAIKTFFDFTTELCVSALHPYYALGNFGLNQVEVISGEALISSMLQKELLELAEKDLNLLENEDLIETLFKKVIKDLTELNQGFVYKDITINEFIYGSRLVRGYCGNLCDLPVDRLINYIDGYKGPRMQMIKHGYAY